MTSNPGILRLAPHSPEAEEAVIGGVLTDPDLFLGIAAYLRPEDFHINRLAIVWEAMMRVADRNDGIDVLTVSEEIRAIGKAEQFEDKARGFLVNLINRTPTSVHTEAYARVVERLAIRRRLLTAADEIKTLAYDEQLPIERITSEAESRLFRVTERNQRGDLVPMYQAIDTFFASIEHKMQHPDEPMGLPTGFRDLDGLLSGLQRSDLLIFAGRPGSGKTSWMLSIALNAAKFGARILIFTMEMGHEQIVQRFVSMETGINTQKLRTGQLDQREYSRFVEATGRLGNLNIFIDDSAAITPIEMRTKCRRIAHEFGLDLVIVDYLQLMSAGAGYENNRVQEVSYISRALKEMARELNVPVLSAAQLSRAVEQRQDKHPQLSDLRESGCLTGESLVYLPDTGDYVPIRDLQDKSGFRVLSLNTETWKLESAEVSHAFCTGVKFVYKLTTQLGRTIRATGNHKFLTINGWKRLDELATEDCLALPSLDRLVRQEKRILFYAANGHSVIDEPCIQDSDVNWDAIVSIEPDGESEVFDLTVPGNHNFVANNLIVHNSLEQDADIVMFLYRDIMYNEATEFPNKAEVIVAKHRNGPTGTIDLHFERSLTKFSDAKTMKIDLGSL